VDGERCSRTGGLVSAPWHWKERCRCRRLLWIDGVLLSFDSERDRIEYLLFRYGHRKRIIRSARAPHTRTVGHIGTTAQPI